MIRIYSGWGYVGSRLQSKVIEYEETGWYDGNFEPKTDAEYKRDQFLYRSDVKPAVDRVKVVTLAAAALWVGSCIALNAAGSMKPRFDEYNPTVLERVRYDESFAAEAAQASGGRPTYCDNRYYRAVANGGQGKNNERRGGERRGFFLFCLFRSSPKIKNCFAFFLFPLSCNRMQLKQ